MASYAEYLKDLLRPLRCYDTDAGAGAAELDAEGAALDGICTALEETEREGLLWTAEGRGLQAYEQILPFVPSYLNLEDRRRAIAALLRIGAGNFTVQALNDAVTGCGIRAIVRETGTARTVEVSFPYNRGVPLQFEKLCTRIEEILPCHLAVNYVFVYLSWEELETWFLDWANLEETAENWGDLERYLPETE